MMFSGKLFAIISAVLVVAVNGSPVDPTVGNGSPADPAGGNPQPETVTPGTISPCDGCSGQPFSLDPDVCRSLPDELKTDLPKLVIAGFDHCNIFTDSECTKDPHLIPLTDAVPANFANGPIYAKCQS